MEVNLMGTLFGIQAVAPSMERGGGGSIVNISSVGGIIAVPTAAPYVTSKWAVRGLTKAAAIELAPLGIRVNSVHPGAVDTDMLRSRQGKEQPRCEPACAAAPDCSAIRDGNRHPISAQQRQLVHDRS